MSVNAAVGAVRRPATVTVWRHRGGAAAVVGDRQRDRVGARSPRRCATRSAPVASRRRRSPRRSERWCRPDRWSRRRRTSTVRSSPCEVNAAAGALVRRPATVTRCVTVAVARRRRSRSASPCRCRPRRRCGGVAPVPVRTVTEVPRVATRRVPSGSVEPRRVDGDARRSSTVAVNAATGALVGAPR